MQKITISVPDGVAKFFKKNKLSPQEKMVAIALFFYPLVYDQKISTKDVGDFMGLSIEDIREIYRTYDVADKHSSVLDDMDFIDRVYFNSK